MLILYEAIVAWLSLLECVLESVLLLLLWTTYVRNFTFSYTVQSLDIYLLYPQINNIFFSFNYSQDNP